MEEVTDFCGTYIKENYPTIEHFKEINVGIITQDMMEYITKYALMNRKSIQTSNWQEIMTEKEHQVFLKYNQQKIQQKIEDLHIPTLYGYYIEEPLHEFNLHKELKEALSRDLSYLCAGSLSLLLDPKGVLYGRIKPHGFTLLHKVIQEHEERFHHKVSIGCSCSLVKFLIDNGADINAKDYNGITPFDAAAGKLLLSSLEIMLKTGKINHEQINSALFSITSKVSDISAEKFEKCLKLLHAYGGKLNSLDLYDNSLLNHYLFLNENEQRGVRITKILVQNCPNWFRKNKFGLSPLHSCCAVFLHSDISDILNYLCSLKSISLDERDNYSRSPLIYAVMRGFKKCCNTLLSHGADINLKDKHGLTSLHYASMLHDASVFELLLSNDKADVHAEDRFGDIPLVYAAATGQSSIIGMLYRLHNVNNVLHDRLLSVAEINDHSNCVIDLTQIIEQKAKTGEKKTQKFELGKKRYHNWLKEKIKATAEEEQIEGKVLPLRKLYDLEKLRKTENDEVKSEVTELLTRIADIVSMKDKKLSFVPLLSGSNAEGTKVGVVDEIDFLCNMVFLSSRLHITLLESDILPGYVNLRIDNPQEAYSMFVLQEIKQNFFLSANNVGSQLFDAISAAMSNVEVLSDLHLTWNNDYSASDLISTIHLIWNGRNYKNLEIFIDLVPTIPIMDHVRLSSTFQTINKHLDIGDVLQQVAVVAKRATDGFNERADVLWRYSFSNLETKILLMLPENARAGYKLVKFIREKRICPLLAMPKYYISSYLLKTCLLHEVVNEIKIAGVTSLEKFDDKSWGSKILSRLQSFMETRGNVPHFFHEDVNLGTSDKEAVLAYCEIGKGWLKHPWNYCF